MDLGTTCVELVTDRMKGFRSRLFMLKLVAAEDGNPSTELMLFVVAGVGEVKPCVVEYVYKFW